MRDKGMTMKKLQHIIMIALILLGLVTPALAQEQTDNFNVSAKHAIAIEATTGKVLYEKDATTPDGVASMTKILTAYMVYKAVDQGKITWDTEVDISDYPFNLTVDSEVSNVPLDSRKYTVKQLLDATLISSANSAAIALAEKISGSESAFVDTMTAQLKEWGIADAKLFNASGLNNKYLGDNRYPGSKADDENTMSALDVAIIADHLIKDYPQVLEITKQTETDFEGDNKLTTHNYMLEGQDNYREGVDGLKTGTTELAGASFVAHSNENGMSLITVVMNADNGGEDEAARFTATNELLDYVTQNWEIKTLNTKGQIVKKNDIKVADGDSQTISAKLESDLTVVQKINSKNDAVKIKAKTITAPIKKGDTIGTATFDDKDLVGTGYISDPPQISVTANQSIKKSFFLKVWWNHIVNFFTGNK